MRSTSAKPREYRLAPRPLGVIRSARRDVAGLISHYGRETARLASIREAHAMATCQFEGPNWRLTAFL
jgi:hypothetical protein